MSILKKAWIPHTIWAVQGEKALADGTRTARSFQLGRAGRVVDPARPSAEPDWINSSNG
ncbi:hypothetical protein DY000_02006301 [Brassica cretica]|uniref:Chlorophyll a-b binding protein, chloroplastic n=1 Tax=Brassica cretica TaxID=69181 RepID=A0ABQ7C4T4_BRACR|nr:hypothetical protein DY000_02006301 [Brassica cretica]